MRAPYGKSYEIFLEMQAQGTDDCVLWPYSQNGRGYGVVGKNAKAHRLSCEMAHGPAPTDQKYDAAHSCRNRHCINPRHLRWATPAENQADRVKDGTSNRGSRNGKAKLTESEVRLIRMFTGTHAQAGLEFGVSEYAARDIRQGKRWGWLV